MTSIRVSHQIRAPVGEVFDIADCHENYPQFFRDFDKLSWTTPRHGVGTRLTMEARLGGALLPVEVKTTAVEPGSRISGVFVSGLSGRFDWTFDQDEGTTWVTVTAEYKLPPESRALVVDRSAVDHAFCCTILKALEAMKRMVEARASAAA